MASFVPAILKTLRWEGGYVNDPLDKGGETNYGITKRSYPNLDIKNLTLSQAKDIYLKDFWNPLLLNSVKDQNLANNIFDFGVNAGPKRSVIMLQRILREVFKKTITIDGAMGPKTLEAVASVNSSALNNLFGKARAEYYQSLANRDKTQEKFLRGWLNRANDFFGDNVSIYGKDITENFYKALAAFGGMLILASVVYKGAKS